jgi:hypothetical protein
MTAVQRRWVPTTGIALLALAASVTSIANDFTYDDRGVIFENDRVHALANIPHLWGETYWPLRYGGDGYRPFVMSLFTLQWFAGHGAPWVFHLVNILLAVATGVTVFWLASKLLPPIGAFITAALFAVHPVHVEVTGNVVGQSELVVALCLITAVGFYLKRRTQGTLRWRDVSIISLLFAIALFTKEHAIVLPGLLLAAEWTVIRNSESWRRRVTIVRPLLLVMIAVTLGYLCARATVQRDLAGFIPYPVFRFLRMSAADRIGTMMNEMPRVAQLLVFPIRLSADYSPNDVIIAKGFDLSQLPGYFICLATVLLAILMRDRSPVASFGLCWFIVAYLPVSNLIVPAGFVTAERTLFLPSLGVMLVFGAAAEALRTGATLRTRRIAAVACTALLIGWLARSIDRQRVWKNNDVFFDALMKDAPNGYRAHFLYARQVGLKSRLSEMELQYRKAIRIFPYDAAMTISVADAYTRAGLCAPAVALFEWSYSVEPEAGEARYQYVYCLARLERWADVRREALNGLRLVAPRDVKLMREAVHQANLRLKPAPIVKG